MNSGRFYCDNYKMGKSTTQQTLISVVAIANAYGDAEGAASLINDAFRNFDVVEDSSCFWYSTVAKETEHA